ncbi:MAG TPA: phosphotransferase [Bacilli bacterium]|nr:phosphotransferase [Bacilli bacterium]
MNLVNSIINNLEKNYGALKISKKFENSNCNDVYLLENTSKYVLKIASNSNRINELKEEYEVLETIKDKIDVPKVYKYFDNQEYSYILMEYIDGISLDVLLKENKNQGSIMFDLGKLLKKINSIEIIEKETGEYYLNKQLEKAESNLKANLLDDEEFIINGKKLDKEELLIELKTKKPNNINSSFLHGDFRPKNIIFSNNKYYILDFGLSHIGDCYYDISIFFYYLNEIERKEFLKGYGINNIDEYKFHYYENLSKFLNV